MGLIGGVAVILPATLGDIDTLAALRVAMLGEEEPETTPAAMEEVRLQTVEYLLESLTAADVLAWVAVQDEEAVGMVILSLFRLPPNTWCPQGNTGYVSGLYVRPECRRRGIARALMDTLLAQANAAGCQRLLLHATSQGRALYESLGFRPSADTMAAYMDCPAAR